ncbi:MAG: hypothetical protein IJJ69_13650 [Oscillospiraceae bacterium]|nr:hypothetical protein [Oscillospiraceae bacterium]
MKQKKISALGAGILTACLCGANLSVCAYTPDDVAQKAREAGWPETLIQTGYNQWASGEYSQNELNEAYDSVLEYNEQTEDFIYNQFGIDPDEARQKRAEKEAQQETQAVSEIVQNQETELSASETETQAETAKTSEKFISDSEFISMNMDEKQAYVNSLSSDEKTEFISSLSTEARNSIIKQLPTEDKVAIMQKYIDTASTMGMNVTVDELTEKDISVTVRNNDGIVIDKAEVGVVIDETGISHTKPLLFAGIGILISAGGFGWLYWYIRHTEQDS